MDAKFWHKECNPSPSLVRKISRIGLKKVSAISRHGTIRHVWKKHPIVPPVEFSNEQSLIKFYSRGLCFILFNLKFPKHT